MNLADFNIIPLAKINCEDDHARLGCSNPRWEYCPASPSKEAEYPNISGPAAVDGTGSHLLLELLITQWKVSGTMPYADEYLDRIIGEGHDDRDEGWLIKQDRCDRVEMALCYVERRLGELAVPIDHVSTERRTFPGRFFGRTDWWGTCDLTICGDGILEVIDYKDGRMYVSEVDNKQLKDYALGQMLEDFTICPDCYTSVRTTIIQPKTNQPIRYAEYTVNEIIDHGRVRAAAAAKTDNPNAPMIPGKHCEPWCLHKNDCEARTGLALEGMKLMTTETEVGGDLLQTMSAGQISATDMTAGQLQQLLDATPLIQSLLKQVEDEAMKRLNEGETITGYHIGKGRGSNKWAHEPDVIEKMLKGVRVTKAEMYPVSLISPAQALKLTRLSPRQIKRIQDEMITYVDGKSTLKRGVEKRTEKDVTTLFGDVVKPKTVEAAPVAASLSFL